MTRGIYAAAAGMRVQLRRQEMLANNLANADTVGYRRSDLSVGSGFAVAHAQGGAAPVAQATIIDTRPGPLRQTGDPFDLALSGPGLFALQTERGLRYTRDGRFHVDAQGRLLSLGGHPVMGRAGPIVLPGAEFVVSERGEVFSGGQLVDELFIAQFEAADGLRRDPDGLLSAARGPRPADQPQVVQGALEQANVSVVREMAAMMAGFRAFEASAAALRQTDQTLSKLIESTG